MLEPHVFHENFILDPGSNSKKGNVLIWEEYSGKDGAHLFCKDMYEKMLFVIFFLIYKFKLNRNPLLEALLHCNTF